MPAAYSNGIKAMARETLGRILENVLADECSLWRATREYRGNVCGPNLHSLHCLFDEQRRQLDFWLRKLLERTRGSGLVPECALDASDSKEADAASGLSLEPRRMVGDLLARHEKLARLLCADVAAVGDRALAEVLTRLREFHETSAWMLRILHDGPQAALRE
jgi:starvation-inducible DNA-binding protein